MAAAAAAAAAASAADVQVLLRLVYSSFMVSTFLPFSFLFVCLFFLLSQCAHPRRFLLMNDASSITLEGLAQLTGPCMIVCDETMPFRRIAKNLRPAAHDPQAAALDIVGRKARKNRKIGKKEKKERKGENAEIIWLS